ncbi:MAG TPA: PDZ domain-containing protein [Candidatus Nanopelagicales bacterium]|nr:PDZ domain-containing protein [Candidatus Nanopelagicales bacterium]
MAPPRIRPARLLLSFLLLIALLGVLGCPAVYPELGTRLREPAPGQVLEPPPPEDLRWIRFLAGKVPERTRDGRAWDQVLGSLPDPYARLLINGKEVLRTKIQADTLEPTWPDSEGGNLVVKPEDRLRLEMWDSNTLNDKPIGVRDIRTTDEHRSTGRISVELEGGGRLDLTFEPAHAKVGLGLWYELRTSTVFITRLSPGGPAERAGVKRGDEVLAIGGREVRRMSPGQVRSAFNSVPLSGIVLLLKHPAGSTETVTVVEGPIYPNSTP